MAEDAAEAPAHLVDPFDLVGAVPGIELRQTSWSGERIGHDPGSPDWDPGEDDDGQDDPEDGKPTAG
ncbi:hypothetical protein ACIRFH_26125 [Streptomyces sp. NPDC093586]|uniref:hypothetical protein n=1 Tax=Streptomyces sp. NPDC093586 TaxID=3366042 RepID=UPI0038025C70